MIFKFFTRDFHVNLKVLNFLVNNFFHFIWGFSFKMGFLLRDWNRVLSDPRYRPPTPVLMKVKWSEVKWSEKWNVEQNEMVPLKGAFYPRASLARAAFTLKLSLIPAIDLLPPCLWSESEWSEVKWSDAFLVLYFSWNLCML